MGDDDVVLQLVVRRRQNDPIRCPRIGCHAIDYRQAFDEAPETNLGVRFN